MGKQGGGALTMQKPNKLNAKNKNIFDTKGHCKEGFIHAASYLCTQDRREARAYNRDEVKLSYSRLGPFMRINWRVSH